MYRENALEEYQEQEPKNRKERRKLLKNQGWYYRLYFIPPNSWVVYKVSPDGYKEEHDKSGNYKSKG